MPRTTSLCGTVLDRNEALLFSYPARHFAVDVPFGPPVDAADVRRLVARVASAAAARRQGG
ncbi:hypothetical protein ACMHYB_34225 [Sorangium sp. So ce1128]